MDEVVAFVVAHHVELLAACALVASAAVVLARLTPNKVDDKVAGVLKSVFDSLRGK